MGEGSVRDTHQATCNAILIYDQTKESRRQRAAALMKVVQRNRNWIAAYPVDCLLAFLEDGVLGSTVAKERNWYLLQCALLRIADGAPPEEIRALLTRVQRDAEGRVAIEAADYNLLDDAERYARSR